jgi:predicted metalloprotease
VEDRRGGGGRFVRGAGGMGIGTVVILLVLSLIFKRDMFQLVGGGGAGGAPGVAAGAPVNETPEERRLVDFVSFILDDAQAVWDSVLPANGAQYRPARVVLFRDAIQSACGFAESATGPFYCPGDEKVYIDLGFYQELQSRFGAPGDFAQAYVLAHEIGHHVQHVLGTDEQVRAAQQRNPGAANQLSVRLELQADCYAGVWGHTVYRSGDLERGDVEEAMTASEAIGDDRLQERAGRRADPDSFTHGTSAQRARWFRSGQREGDPNSCDTFSVETP